MRTYRIAILCVCVLGCFELNAYAQPAALKTKAPIAEVTSLSGKVKVLRKGELLPLSKGAKIYLSDQVVTSDNGAAQITFADGSHTVALPNSSVDIEEFYLRRTQGGTILESTFNLIRGKAKFFFNPKAGKRNGQVKTSSMLLGVRGTSLLVTEEKITGASEVVVFSGQVEASAVSSKAPPVVVSAGEVTKVTGATAAPEQPRPATAIELKRAETLISSLPLKVEESDTPPQTISMPAPIEYTPPIATVPPPISPAPSPVVTQETPSPQTEVPQDATPVAFDWDAGLFGRVGFGLALNDVGDDGSPFEVSSEIGPVLVLNPIGYRSSSFWAVSLFIHVSPLDKVMLAESYDRTIVNSGVRFDFNFLQRVEGESRSQWFAGFGPSRADIEVRDSNDEEVARKGGAAFHSLIGYENHYNRNFGYSFGAMASIGRLGQATIEQRARPVNFNQEKLESKASYFSTAAFASFAYTFDL